jgi:hypothetical protein
VILHMVLFDFSQDKPVFTRAIGTESDGESSSWFGTESRLSQSYLIHFNFHRVIEYQISDRQST